jgi:hypothetical protein
MKSSVIPPSFSCHSPAIPLSFSCHSPSFSCHSPAIPLSFSCHSPGYSLVIPRLFPCYSPAIPLLFPCYSPAIPLLFPCYSLVIPMSFTQDSTASLVNPYSIPSYTHIITLLFTYIYYIFLYFFYYTKREQREQTLSSTPTQRNYPTELYKSVIEFIWFIQRLCRNGSHNEKWLAIHLPFPRYSPAFSSLFTRLFLAIHPPFYGLFSRLFIAIHLSISITHIAQIPRHFITTVHTLTSTAYRTYFHFILYKSCALALFALDTLTFTIHIYILYLKKNLHVYTYMNICKIHKIHENETMISPCRFLCRVCKLKKVHGFSNPDHVSNPFGYLFLAPKVCLDCTKQFNICMWC